MSPTLAEALRWSPAELTTRATAAHRAADDAMDGRRILPDGREALDVAWHGLAATAALDAVESEVECASRLVTAIDRLEAAVAGAAYAIGAAHRALRSTVEEAEHGGFVVGPDVDATELAEANRDFREKKLDTALEVIGLLESPASTATGLLAPWLKDTYPGEEPDFDLSQHVIEGRDEALADTVTSRLLQLAVDHDPDRLDLLGPGPRDAATAPPPVAPPRTARCGSAGAARRVSTRSTNSSR